MEGSRVVLALKKGLRIYALGYITSQKEIEKLEGKGRRHTVASSRPLTAPRGGGTRGRARERGVNEKGKKKTKRERRIFRFESSF
jgi:hypothetical protein